MNINKWDHTWLISTVKLDIQSNMISSMKTWMLKQKPHGDQKLAFIKSMNIKMASASVVKINIREAMNTNYLKEKINVHGQHEY